MELQRLETMSPFDIEFACFHSRVQSEIADVHEVLDYLAPQPDPDAFAVLRVASPATPDQVQTAFLDVEDLVRQRTKGSRLSNHALRRITKEAHDILREPEKQLAYQQWIAGRAQARQREAEAEEQRRERAEAQARERRETEERREAEGRTKQPGRRGPASRIVPWAIAFAAATLALIGVVHAPAPAPTRSPLPAPYSPYGRTVASLRRGIVPGPAPVVPRPKETGHKDTGHAEDTKRQAERSAQAAKRTIDDVQVKMVAFVDQQDQQRLTRPQADSAKAVIRTRCRLALQQADDAIAKDKTNQTAWLERVAARYYMADYQGAREDLQTAKALFPGSSDFKPLAALVNRGLLQSKALRGA